MISYAEALQRLRAQAQRQSEWAVEEVPLHEATGRVAATDIFATDDNPRFDNSAMDGFAVIASGTATATAGAPLSLPVVGSLKAGDSPRSLAMRPGECIEIMTGARMPEPPIDAVVRVEDTLEKGSVEPRRIVIDRPVRPGENVRFRGSDIRKNDRLVSRGTLLGPQHTLVLAMIGHRRVSVMRAPRIIIISTGDEVESFDVPDLRGEAVRNCTAPFLSDLLTRYGAQVQYRGIIPDRSEEIRNAIVAACASNPDVVITTGGVSVGKFDLLRSVYQALGARIDFYGVAVRPGKPVLFGELPDAGPAVFGIPGNPVSVVTTARFFVRPYLRALLSEPAEVPEHCLLECTSKKPDGLTYFQRGTRCGVTVAPLEGQASFAVRSLLQAHGWIVCSPEGSLLPAGAHVEWYPLW